MRFYDAETIRAALPWPRIIDALRGALRSDVHAPLRVRHSIAVPGQASGSLLMMPAWRKGGRLGVKLVTVFPGNADRGARSVGAVYILFDASDGRPLALFEGEEITARRTAAASALAASDLSRSDAHRLLMVGSGRQARGLVEAHASVRPLEQIRVWSRTLAHAQRAVAALRERKLPAEVCTELERGVREADIVSCATLSTHPLVMGAWLQPGTHLDLVGAFKRDMRESDDEAMRRADTLIVDDRSAALAEGGDIVQAIASGAIDEARIAGDLRSLVTGAHGGRKHEGEITVFKSVGFALEDLAAAEAVLDAQP